MKLPQMFSAVVSAALTAAAFAQQTADDQKLIDQAARMKQARVEAAQTASGVDDESAARAQVALAQARLELVLARKALARGELQAAADRAQAVLAVLSGLPSDVGAAEEYRLQAEGVLARAARSGVRPSAAGGATAVASPMVEVVAPQGAPGGRYGVIEVGAREARDFDLEQRYRADEWRMLRAGDAARVVPGGDVAYPGDWPQRIERRSAYEGGRIAQSPTWTDADGREWSAAIYDVHDLIYVPPDFQIPGGFNLAEDTRNLLDRAALRERSQIFGGYAEDLAMGLPLLRYFGGIDDFAFRGPKYSAERQRQLVVEINAFLARESQAKIVVIPPANP